MSLRPVHLAGSHWSSSNSTRRIAPGRLAGAFAVMVRSRGVVRPLDEVNVDESARRALPRQHFLKLLDELRVLCLDRLEDLERRDLGDLHFRERVDNLVEGVVRELGERLLR